ncbi:hypothetical protein DFH11DRAFT_195062 [Phellopilus nigrolimitatus]|nr:hypothetical protein DFH11DRAFT_195062 [Phellopilus nigrolimitatus]
MLLTLQILARSLEEMNAKFKERTDCMARRQGLDSLPDEILSHILGSVTSDFNQALALSYVCTRFRKVMLDFPHIWANCRLNTSMSLRKIKTFVDRSRNCPLKIDIGPLCYHWNRHVKYLFSLKDRLEDVEFQRLSAHEGEPILRHYPAIRMPGLRKLTIRNGFGHHLFYVSWCLPSLKYLGFTDFIPEPVFRQNLSYCHMKFTVRFQPEELDHFLQSLTSLKTLEIELVGINDIVDSDSDDEDDDDDDDDGSIQEDLSSRISSISFSVVGKTSVPFARRVLRTIRLNVTEMLFTIVYPKCCDHDNYYKIHCRREDLLKSMRHFPMIKKLHLHFSGPDADYDLGFGQVLRHAPQSLENLRIEAPGHTFFMPVCNHTTPELRTLHFSNCDRIDLVNLAEVRDNFDYDDVVIGKVEVAGCRLIEEEKLRDTFPDSEVVWKP